MAYKRGLGKNNCNYRLKDIYKEYKQKSNNPVDYSTFAAFIKEYNKRIVTAIIYENLCYKMPYRMGDIRIQKRRLIPFVRDGKVIKGHILPDWEKTLVYWRKKYPDKTDQEIKEIPGKKVLKYLNEHTNGDSARFFWEKAYSNVKNQSCYIYKATRTAKEEIARLIKRSGRVNYFE